MLQCRDYGDDVEVHQLCSMVMWNPAPRDYGLKKDVCVEDDRTETVIERDSDFQRHLKEGEKKKNDVLEGGEKGLMLLRF